MAKKETKPEDCQLCACIGCSEGNCCEHEGRRDVWEQLSSATGHSYFIQDIFKRKMSDLSDTSLALSVGLNNKTLEWEERAAIIATGVMAIQKIIDLSDYEYSQVYNDPKCVACQCDLCRKKTEDIIRRLKGNWGMPVVNTCCGHKEMSVHSDGLPF